MRITLIYILLLNYTFCFSQQDTVIVEELTIVSNNPRANVPGTSNTSLKQSDASGTIVFTLLQNSNIYIKQNGPGSLATTSIRGGSAGHTLVLWNGLPLQSPLLGLLDFSLIPSDIGEQVSLQKGGGSSLWGSGAVSGIIALDSKKIDDYTFKFRSTVGSFGQIGQDFSFNIGTDKWRSTTKLSYLDSDRDFEYAVSPDLPLIKQTNAQFDRLHLQQDFYCKLNRKSELAAHLWIHDSYTEIPSLTTQTKNEAYQEDSAIRGLVSYKYIGNSTVWEAKVSHFIDRNDYYDPPTLLTALNRYNTTFVDISGYKVLKYHTFLIGGTYNYTDVTSREIAEERISLFASFGLKYKPINLQISFRQQLIDGKSIPIVPNLGLTYEILPALNLRAKLSRDYRTPTINDRYWEVVGDPDLLPESGWSKEIGLDWNRKFNQFTVTSNITVYHRLVENWIMWTPINGSFFWSPQNINQVLSKGLEQVLSISYKTNHRTIGLSAAYDYTSSTFRNALTLPMIDAGEQLLYTPKHQGRVQATFTYKGFNTSYQQRWLGSVTGANENIDASQVGVLSIGYGSQFARMSAKLELTIDNIWDSAYFIVERRPTPGRNYRIAFTLKY